MALLAQSGLFPYAYTRTLMKSGIPHAGPPRPCHVAAHSYVPLRLGAVALVLAVPIGVPPPRWGRTMMETRNPFSSRAWARSTAEAMVTR